jgi:iron complex outermembrane receptor protein
VVVRGFQRGDLNVFIDGQRVYGACPNRMDPPAFHVDFAEVERVEVAKGPFDLKSQGSVGGTVNIVTRRPEEGAKLDTNLAAGSYGYVNPSAAASYGSSSLSVLGGISYRTSDAYADGAGQRFTEITNFKESAVHDRAFKVGTAWGRAGWSPTQDDQLQLSYTRQNVDRNFYPYLKMDAIYDDTDRVSVRYDREKDSGSLSKLAAQGYFNRVGHWMTDEFRTSSLGVPRSYMMGTLANTQTYGGRVDMQLQEVELGVEAFNRFWGAQTELAGMGYRPQYSLPDVTLRDIGVYAEYSHSLSDAFSLTVGGRLDHARSFADEAKANTNLYFAYNGTRSTSAADTFPSGKLRLTYHAAPGLELSGGLGHTVRVPEQNERYFALQRMGSDWVGNPDLVPTRNTGVDAALTFETRGFYLGGSLYFNWIADSVVLHDQEKANAIPGVMSPKARSYSNLDATMWGGEIDAGWAVTDRLNLSGDLSYVSGTKKTAPELDIFSENLAEIPPLRSRLRLRYDTWRWFVLGEGVFSARQENVDTDLGEQVTPGYAIANVRIGIRYRRLTVSVGVNNLFDKYYFEHLSYYRDPFASGVRVPEPGRNLYLNVAYPF